MADTSFLSSIIPNFGGMSGQASSVISNMLNGTPSASTTRNAVANFGAANGLGVGSGVANRFGYDLYNQQGQQRQQGGIQDLLSYIAGISNPTLANQGQNLQNQQFAANLNNQRNEFNISNQTQQNSQLQALLAQLGGGLPTQSAGAGQFSRN